jgi:hypothetical protein
VSSTVGLIVIIGVVLLGFLALAYSQFTRRGSGIEPRGGPVEGRDDEGTG